jgi:hypothetical protein
MVSLCFLCFLVQLSLGTSLTFVLDVEALQLFNGMVEQTLSQTALEPMSFGPVPIGSGLSLRGTMSAKNGIVCSGLYQTQTVPLGVLTNATDCAAQLEVVWQVVSSGSKIMCSNSSTVTWNAKFLVYCSWGLMGVLANRIEARGINATNLTTCGGEQSGEIFNSLLVNATAAQLSLILAKQLPFKEDFSPFPDLPLLALNLSMAQSPSVQRTNISGALVGLFYQSGDAPFFPLACGSIPPWGSLPRGHLGLRLGDCFFDSLGLGLHSQGIFDGKLTKELLGLTFDIFVSSKPLDFVSQPRSSALNATVRLELESGEFDRAAFVFKILLPLNLSISETLLVGAIPAVRIENLNATFDVENYNLPVKVEDLKPLLLVLLQEDLLPMFNKVLATGVELPFKIAAALLTVGNGFVEITGKNA